MSWRPEATAERIVDRESVQLAGSTYRVQEVHRAGLCSTQLIGPRGAVYEIAARHCDLDHPDTGVRGIFSLTNGMPMRRNDSIVLAIVIGDIIEETTAAALADYQQRDQAS